VINKVGNAPAIEGRIPDFARGAECAQWTGS